MLPSLRVTAFLALKTIIKGNIGVTILTVLILVLVSLNLLFVPGLINGLVISANDMLINNYCSDIIVEAKGHNPKINHVTELISEAESLDGVVAATARNSIGATLKFKDNQNEERRTNANIYGIMPEKEKKVFDTSKYLIEGSYLSSRDRNEILLGVQIAGIDDEKVELYASSLRNVHAGDKITVAYSNGIVKEYKVKGIFQTGFIQTDIQAFISDLEYKSIVPSMQNMASSVHIKLENNASAEKVIERLRLLHNDLEYQTWEQNAGIVNSMTTSFKIINQILNMVNALVAGITIFIVTYVDVINRKPQIGILRAIGIKRRPIIYSYLVRAIFYVVIGLILATLLFMYAIIPLEARHPFHFPFGPAFLVIDLPLFIRTAILLSAVSLVAAFIPVWLVIRIKILDAVW